jgi:catechol-2,3-dioxygenase
MTSGDTLRQRSAPSVIMSVVFDHVEIHVSDLAASRAFYGEALGLPTIDGELGE